MGYAYATDSGFDARACMDADFALAPHSRARIPLGFSMQCEPGYGYAIRARSGCVSKLGLGMANGVGTIDGGYTGEVAALVYNFSDAPISITRGMKIAQVVIEPVIQAEFEEVSDASAFSSDRGGNGFGSSGI
jgi:dUTP pyrophosphatase